VTGNDKLNMKHCFMLDDGGGRDLCGHSVKVKVQQSASAAKRILQPELSLHGTVCHLQSCRLRLSMAAFFYCVRPL